MCVNALHGAPSSPKNQVKNGDFRKSGVAVVQGSPKPSKKWGFFSDYYLRLIFSYLGNRAEFPHPQYNLVCYIDSSPSFKDSDTTSALLD